MTTNELYLKTIFCCMACDGDIAPEEVAMVRELSADKSLFGEMDVEQTLNRYVEGINANGATFLKKYLDELGKEVLDNSVQLKIVELSVQTILADNKIEYSEVKFFKKIRARLSLTDEQILAKHPEIESWLLPDIKVMDDPEWRDVTFSNIKICKQ